MCCFEGGDEEGGDEEEGGRWRAGGVEGRGVEVLRRRGLEAIQCLWCTQWS